MTNIQTESNREISENELAVRIASGRAPLIAEILGPSYFAQGHLPGAVNLPLEGLVERATALFPDRSA
ncbi:MAG TPA: hypothetical protein VFQ35_25030, partial [Polyangiaceae bacterium]|nr:hypothetical protein [Polyangiaceae bacterium]